MKYIIKRNAPQELHRWFDNQPIQNGHRLNCSYADMPGEVKEAVKQNLLDEQGGLCCYTGQRINDESSHIEHFKPQSLCENHEDVDYANLLAAYPGVNARKHSYGAHAKADWYDTELLVSPLKGDCESRFRFNPFGDVKPTQEHDLAAIETIKRLCLNHDSLTQLRQLAINTALFPKNRQPSKAYLQRIVEEVCERDAKRQFKPFCFVITQAAQALLRKAERKQKRRQAIQQQRRR